MYQEEEPSVLEHQGHRYSVNARLRVAAAKKRQWVALGVLQMPNIWCMDLDRVRRADYTYPIILLDAPQPPYVILDGAHRVAHAQLDALLAVTAVWVSAAELETARVHSSSS
jgi:hypothetical protein